MCRPISLISDGKGNIFCFPWDIRKQIYAGELKDYEPDSHTSTAHFYGFKGAEEDLLNKWEYDFATAILIPDQINATDDHEAVKAFLEKVGPDYFYPPNEVAKITRIIGDLYISGIPLIWASLTEVKGNVRDCKDCQFPVLTEVKGNVWECKDCQFPVLTEVKGDVWECKDCQFPVLTEVKGNVWECKDCQFPVLKRVNGKKWEL